MVWIVLPYKNSLKPSPVRLATACAQLSTYGLALSTFLYNGGEPYYFRPGDTLGLT